MIIRAVPAGSGIAFTLVSLAGYGSQVDGFRIKPAAFVTPVNDSKDKNSNYYCFYRP